MVKLERADEECVYEEARRVVSNKAFSFVLYTCQALMEQQKGDRRSKELGRELGVLFHSCSIFLRPDHTNTRKG